MGLGPNSGSSSRRYFLCSGGSMFSGIIGNGATSGGRKSEENSSGFWSTYSMSLCLAMKTLLRSDPYMSGNRITGFVSRICR